MSELAVGTLVRVIDPSSWVKAVASKLTDRVGVVKTVRERGIHRRNVDYIVTFPAIGRRKEFTPQFDERDLRVEEEQQP